MPGPAFMSHILRVNFSDLWTLTQTHRDFTCVTLAAIRFGCVCAGFCVYCLGRRARRHNIVSEEESQDSPTLRWTRIHINLMHTRTHTHTIHPPHQPLGCASCLSLSFRAHIWSLTTDHTSALACHAPSSQSLLLSSTDAPHSVNAWHKLIYERRYLHTRARKMIKGWYGLRKTWSSTRAWCTLYRARCLFSVWL